MSNERLQKILAQAGIASRRKAEEMIEQGLVTVNGQVAKLGDKADFESDHIKVEGKLLKKLEDPFYVVMNKPKGVISMTSDPEGRPHLGNFLSKLKVRVNPIGRLDFNSEGLLLLTNDGALADKIQKSDAFPRVYHVKVKGYITTEMVSRLSRGMRVGNKSVKPLAVRIHEELNKKTKIEISFMNDVNSTMSVKTYFEEKGFLVEKITRTAIGQMTLAGLEPGEYRTVPKTKFEALILQPELGLKALTLRHEKEREILPRDQRLRNVDEHGKVISKRPATEEEEAESKASARFSEKAAAKAEADRIVVRATGDLAAVPGAKKKKSPSAAGADMPAFKRRTSERAGSSAGRSGSSRSGAGPKFGARPSRSADDQPRFGSRGPRSEGGAKSFGSRGPRSEGGAKPFGSRGPRSEGGAKSFGSRGPRSEGGAKSFGSRGPRSEGGAKSFGSRGPRSEGGAKSFGSRGPRSEGSKPSFGGGSKPRFSARPGSGSSSGRPSGKPASARTSSGRPSSGRTAAGRTGAGRPSAGRPISRVKRREK
jgi:23S rRNA pseudouridine2605 synthase